MRALKELTLYGNSITDIGSGHLERMHWLSLLGLSANSIKLGFNRITEKGKNSVHLKLNKAIVDL